MRIFSMSAMPLDFSSRSAMRQYGQTPVEYIRTLAMAALLLERQARLAPFGEAALQLEDGGEALRLQGAGGGAGAGAALARDDHGLGLELRELAYARRQLLQRHVARARQVALGEL